VTVRPAAGAGLSRVTVPVAAAPALTRAGVIARPASFAGSRVS
jgi:hypothetical protein